MSFHWPYLLWLLLALPLLVVAYLAQERVRKRASERFARPAMQPNVVPLGPGWRRHLPPALLLVAVALLLIAFARPERTERVPRERATIMIVMDASRSMEATDVEPTRLAAAKRAARALLAELPPKFRVGLVTFGRRAQVLSAPTVDREAVRNAIASIETTFRTLLGEGIVLGLEAAPALRKGEPMVMLLLSDGVPFRSEVAPLDAANQAAEASVRINTVLMGTDPAQPGSGGGTDGQVLRDIARATGGRFFTADTSDALTSVYRDIGARVSRVTEVRELTYAFVAGGALAAMLAAAFAALWFRRLL